MDEWNENMAKMAAMSEPAGQIGIRRSSVVPAVKARLVEHEKQAQKCRDLLNLLERNPDFEHLLNLSREIL